MRLRHGSAPSGNAAARLIVTFPVPVPHNFTEPEVLGLLEKQGYTRVFAAVDGASGEAREAQRADSKKSRQPAEQVVLEMIQDRLRFDADDRARMIEALEAALRVGQGRVKVHLVER